MASIEAALPLFAAELSERAATVGGDFNDVFKLARERLFARSEVAPIKGRRARAVKVLTALGSALPESQEYCKDLVTVIRALDDLSEGTLKDIAELDLKDQPSAFGQLQTLIPPHFVKNVFERAERERGERKLILFAEEFPA
jgi:hypothetical protein